MTHLSVDAKEFVPKVHTYENKSRGLKGNSSLSVDVPEFVPKDNLSGNNAKKTEKTLQVEKNINKTFEKKNVKEEHNKGKNPKDSIKNNSSSKDKFDQTGEKTASNLNQFNARHDRGWFHRNPMELNNQKEGLKRADSYNIDPVSRLNQSHKAQLVHTYSTGFPDTKQKRKLQIKHSLKVEEPKDVNKQSISWSSIVKTTSSVKTEVDRRASLTPNTGHSRDLRTMNYDVERDKRAKLNKLKKASSLLGSLDTKQNSSPKSLQKRLSHRLLTESKSLGPYDIDLDVPKPRVDIKRKSLVLEAKRSASIKQDPDMDNWFEKDVPATIELFSTLSKTSAEPKPVSLQIEPTEKRKLTRTTKKVFSPSAVMSAFPDKKAVNDNYFFSDVYKDTGPKDTLIQERKNISKDEDKSSTRKEIIASNIENIPAATALLSYSSMVKKSAPPDVTVQKIDVQDVMSRVKDKPILTSEEIRLLKKSKKKEKKKMKKQQRIEEKRKELQEQGILLNQTTNTVNKKKEKRTRDIALDLSNMVETLMAAPKPSKSKSRYGKGRQKKVVVSTGVVSVVSGLAKKNKHDGKRTARNKYGGTGVIMDGATPIVIRGKERLTPKRKKPTLLKKIIQAERERKRLLQENDRSSANKNPNTKTQDEKPAMLPPEEISKIPEESVKHEKDDATPSNELLPPIQTDALAKDEQKGETDAVTERKKLSLRPCEPLCKLPEQVWKQLHSRKFREYCDHMLTKEINDLTYQLLITLQRFQDRVYHENPTKFKQRRRFVLGLREVLKHTKLKKIKAIIVAPNLERISSEGGLDDYLRSILLLCDEYELPKIFALNRHGLGKILKKKAPVSIVGIFSYDGAQDTFKELLHHVEEARKIYSGKIHNLLNKNDKLQNKNIEKDSKQKSIPIVEIVDLTRCTNLERADNFHNEAESLRQKMISKLKNNEG